MTKFAAAGMFSLGLAVFGFADESSLVCEVIDDGIEKIQCTFVTPRKNEARETTFYWHSESFPQDDRERSITLPANHGSVYDYRFLRGRAQGIWNVTVTLTDTDGSVSERSHHFLLEDNRIVNER